MFSVSRRLLWLLPLMFCLNACRSPWYPEAAQEALDCHLQRMCHKYELELVAVEYFYPKGILNQNHLNGLTVIYYGRHVQDVQGAREIAVDSMKSLLYHIENDSSLADRFICPVECTCIELQIDFDHFFAQYFDINYVGHVVIKEGWINYYSFNDELLVREPFYCAEEVVCHRFQKACEEAERRGYLDRQEAWAGTQAQEPDVIVLPQAKQEPTLLEAAAEPEESAAFRVEHEWTGAGDEFEQQTGVEGFDGFDEFDEDAFIRQEDALF